MNKSETIGELAQALVKAQSQFPPIVKSIKVDFATKSGVRVKYSYAPLSSVIDACRKALVGNGIALSQPTRMVDDRLFVETMLIHSSGEWLSGEISISPVDRNPQSEGSALTYARRYGLASLLGIASEDDDDAEGAMARGEKDKQKPSTLLSEAKKIATPATTTAAEASTNEPNYKAFYTHCGNELGLDQAAVHDLLNVQSVKDDLVIKANLTLKQVYAMLLKKVPAREEM